MKKNILVVDDDPMNLKLAEFTLAQNGYDVITASSGEEGITKLKRGNISLVLLDIEMPGMNGIETLTRIREDDGTNGVPVVFLTSSGDKQDVINAGKLGAVGYVKKPFLPKELLERVGKVIG